MAIVILALNGEGLGHLIRTTIVCNLLQEAGERPILFSQGIYQPEGASRFPTLQVPSLWRAPEEVRRKTAAQLHTMAAISLPAVVVEDTHPNPIRLPAEVRRVLLVRPTSFEYLSKLRGHYGAVYAKFLLCDSPDSPTWPYTSAETEAITGWEHWHIIGPIYRKATGAEIRSARSKYALSDDRELYVFTMGGGGTHDPNDIGRFISLATQVAKSIERARSKVRLMFVRGPYFPVGTEIPQLFEVVAEEPSMHALLANARGAVVRAGYNTTWECLGGGIPFTAMVGTTVAEPVPERLMNLGRQGLLAGDINAFWRDDEWRSRFQRLSQTLGERFPGRPEPQRLVDFIAPRIERSPTAPLSSVLRADRSIASPRAIRWYRSRKRLRMTIRIDDVTVPEPTLVWLLEHLGTRGLRASLEVVPYLAGFDESFLDGVDPTNTLFEVSQHGYAHVPRTANGGARCEFDPRSACPTEQEIALIGQGRQQLASAFPKRFAGGFSPPFDALPVWLPLAWQAEGGRFVTCLYANRLAGSPLPVARGGTDIWDWSRDRAWPRHVVRRRLESQAAADGYVGLVLHPRCLRSSWERARLVSILNFMQRSGVTTTSLRELATTWVPEMERKLTVGLRMLFGPKRRSMP